MANQYPTVVPVGFNGTYTDYLKAKCDRSGAVRHYKGQVLVPAGTPAGSKIGIIPVRRGLFLAVQGSVLWSDQLDSTNTLTVSVGITYNPTSVIAEAPAQYVSAGSSVFRAGGILPLNGVEGGLTYMVQDDGWLSVTTAGAATNVSNNINYSLLAEYDAGALS